MLFVPEIHADVFGQIYRGAGVIVESEPVTLSGVPPDRIISLRRERRTASHGTCHRLQTVGFKVVCPRVEPGRYIPLRFQPVGSVGSEKCKAAVILVGDATERHLLGCYGKESIRFFRVDDSCVGTALFVSQFYKLLRLDERVFPMPDIEFCHFKVDDRRGFGCLLWGSPDHNPFSVLTETRG